LQLSRRDARASLAKAIAAAEIPMLEAAIMRGQDAQLDGKELTEAEALLELQLSRRDAKAALAKAVECGEISSLEEAVMLGQEVRLDKEELAEAEALLKLQLSRRDARAALANAIDCMDITRLEEAIRLGLEAQLDRGELAEAEALLKSQLSRRDAKAALAKAIECADITRLEEAILLGQEAELHGEELAEAEALLNLQLSKRDARAAIAAAMSVADFHDSATTAHLEHAVGLGRAAQLAPEELRAAEAKLELSRLDDIERQMQELNEKKQLAKNNLKQMGIDVPGEGHKRNRSRSRRKDSRLRAGRARSESLGPVAKMSFLMKSRVRDPRDRPPIPRRRRAQQQSRQSAPSRASSTHSSVRAVKRGRTSSPVPSPSRTSESPRRVSAPKTPSVLAVSRRGRHLSPTPAPSRRSAVPTAPPTPCGSEAPHTPSGFEPLTPAESAAEGDNVVSEGPEVEFGRAMKWVAWKGSMILFVDLNNVASDKAFNLGINAGWKVCAELSHAFIQKHAEWVDKDSCSDQIPEETRILQVTKDIIRQDIGADLQGADVVVAAYGRNWGIKKRALGLLLAIAVGVTVKGELPDMANTLKHNGYPWLVSEAKRLASN